MKFLKVLSAFILMLIVTPSFAQADSTNTVSFNDFSFSFDSTLATHVDVTQYLAAPPDEFPPQGKHIHFVLYGEQAPDASTVGLRVYRIEDLAAYEHTQQQVTQLQALLKERRDLSDYAATADTPLPFLPVVAAGQTMRARVAYVETPEVSGIRYITAYQQAAEPLLQTNFLYTFQGISADGKSYVSAVIRVNPESFPTEMPADFDYQAFVNGLPDYLKESSTQLSSATASAFAPSLDLIDSVVQSFAFES